MTLTDLDPAPAATDRTARRAAGIALVLSALLGVVSTVTQPSPGHSAAERLALMHAAGGRAAVSVLTLTLMQLFLIPGLIGLGALLRPVAPKLAATGTALAVAGAFGESVAGGQSLAALVMARDVAHRAADAALLQQLTTSPVAAPLSLLGLAGSVLGLLVLSIALFRTRTGPVWTAPALWIFLVCEYVGAGISPVLAYLAIAAALAAFVALARELARR